MGELVGESVVTAALTLKTGSKSMGETGGKSVGNGLKWLAAAVVIAAIINRYVGRLHARPARTI